MLELEAGADERGYVAELAELGFARRKAEPGREHAERADALATDENGHGNEGTDAGKIEDDGVGGEALVAYGIRNDE